MDAAFFGAGPMLCALLPEQVRVVRRTAELPLRCWDLLALTREGCRRLAEASGTECVCHTLILPGEWGTLAGRRLHAEQIVTCGLSARESLTYSSLGEEAVLCVQRELSRPEGGSVEPQEIPLPPLCCPPEDYLPVAALRLLLGTWGGR